MAVKNILSVASTASKTLQGQTMILSRHREALEKCADTLIHNFDVRHVIDSERKALGTDNNSIVSDDNSLGVSVESLHSFLDYLGTVSKRLRNIKFSLFFSTSVVAWWSWYVVLDPSLLKGIWGMKMTLLVVCFFLISLWSYEAGISESSFTLIATAYSHVGLTQK